MLNFNGNNDLCKLGKIGLFKSAMQVNHFFFEAFWHFRHITRLSGFYH